MTRILVHGDDRLAIAVADELARRDIELVRPGDAIGDPAQLDAAIFCADDDVANIDVALQLREHAPDLRLVLRSFNLSVQERLPELLGDCHVLSASQLAAAPFCDLAVGVGGPEHGPAGRSRWERAVDRISGSHGAAVARLLWRRPLLRWSLVAIVVLIAFEAALAAAAFGYGPAQALHTGLAAIVTLGFNDAGLIGPALAGEAAWIQIGAVVTTLVDIVLVTVLLGVVADAFVSERFARVFGGSARRLRGHVVIAGLGTVGFRILRELVDRGYRCAVIEAVDDGPFVAAARRLGASVLIADVRQGEEFAQLSIDRAIAFVAVTDDAAANLEAALTATSIAPDVPVVVRCFDPGLAARLETLPAITASRSVARLVAPAFVDAALVD